jgi:hypothetical protein
MTIEEFLTKKVTWEDPKNLLEYLNSTPDADLRKILQATLRQLSIITEMMFCLVGGVLKDKDKQ